MNPYYYLFYKLNRFLNKKGNNEWGPIGGLTFLLQLNIIFIYSFTFKHFNLSLKNTYKVYIFISIFSLLFIFNFFFFLNKKRINYIIPKISFNKLILK